MNHIHPTMAPFVASIAPKRSVPKLPSFEAALGDNIAVTVTYEHTPAEAAVYDVESPVCGPGHDAEIEICEVLLNGEDIRDLLADSVIESLEEQALERHES